MLDVDAYLARIRYAGPTEPTADTLSVLQVAHMRSVPFENLSIHIGERIRLDPDWLYEKIVTRQRGGFCYELNGLFAELLAALGFDVSRLAARVVGDGGALGIPFDHMALRVDVDGEAYLADVGFGDCFRRPLRLFETAPQSDGVRDYRATPAGDAYDVLERHGDEYKPQYRVELHPYALADFAGGCEHHQTSPESHFTQRRVCSLATESGRITLRDDRLITSTDAGTKTEQPIAGAEEWARVLRDRFGIELPGADSAR